MGSVGSAQFQIFPCSSLHFFSRSRGPLRRTLNVNYRVLIHCTCHFQAVPSSLFILASSVCKPLQCLISALTQGGEGGHLFSLTCSVILLRGRDTANKCHWRVCVGRAPSVWTTLGLPQLKEACASRVYTAQAPGFSARVLSQAGPEFCALPRSKLLRFSVLHKGTDLVGSAFCALPRCDSSGDQMLGECTVPGELRVLISSLVLATWFPRCAVRALSRVCRVSPLGSGSQAATLLVDVSHPGSQENVVSN